MTVYYTGKRTLEYNIIPVNKDTAEDAVKLIADLTRAKYASVGVSYNSDGTGYIHLSIIVNEGHGISDGCDLGGTMYVVGNNEEVFIVAERTMLEMFPVRHVEERAADDV